MILCLHLEIDSQEPDVEVFQLTEVKRDITDTEFATDIPFDSDLHQLHLNLLLCL